MLHPLLLEVMGTVNGQICGFLKWKDLALIILEIEVLQEEIALEMLRLEEKFLNPVVVLDAFPFRLFILVILDDSSSKETYIIEH